MLLLASRIDEAIAGADFAGDGVFMRLSSRSPKDAVYEEPMARELVERAVDELADLEERCGLGGGGGTGGNGMAFNLAAVAFFQASVDMLRVRSGIEAVTLLINSDRVFVDLLMGARLCARGGPGVI